MSTQITVPTRCCTWHFNQETRMGSLIVEASTLRLPPGKYPERLLVYSDQTQRQAFFYLDHELAKRHEWWDGEQVVYTPEDALLKQRVKSLVILNT